MTMDNQMIDGDGFEISGKKFKLYYEFNTDKNPNRLDINRVEQDGEKKENNVMTAIVKFDKDNDIVMMASMDGTQYRDFDPTDSKHYFKLRRRYVEITFGIPIEQTMLPKQS